MIQVFGRDNKKKVAEPIAPTPAVTVSSRLRELCSGDEDMYTALSRLLFLDPKKIVAPLQTVVSDAMDGESRGNSLKAEVGYRIAGSISLWKGDAEGVGKYFAKASTFAGEDRPEYRTLAKRPDNAVDIARKYYEVSETGSKE